MLLVDTNSLQSNFTSSHLARLPHELALKKRLSILSMLAVALIVTMSLSLSSLVRIVDDEIFHVLLHLLDVLRQISKATLRHVSHLLIHVMEFVEELQDLLPSDHKQLIFNLGFSFGASNVLAFVQYDLDVAEVGPLDADIDWNVLWLPVRSRAKDVIVELDASLDDEEDFLRWIILAIKGVVFVDLHLAEQWEHLPDELLTLVVKEADLSDDLTMGM